MKRYGILAAALVMMLIMTGCHTVYYRSYPAPVTVTKHKKVYTEPRENEKYEYNEYEEYHDYDEYDEYEEYDNEYPAEEETVVTHSPTYYVETSYHYGFTPWNSFGFSFGWYDYPFSWSVGWHNYAWGWSVGWYDNLWDWYPGWTFYHTYNTPWMFRHCGNYVFGYYYDHRHYWRSYRHSQYPVSYYRYKNDRRHSAYNANGKSRTFRKKGSTALTSERNRQNDRSVSKNGYAKDSKREITKSGSQRTTSRSRYTKGDRSLDNKKKSADRSVTTRNRSRDKIITDRPETRSRNDNLRKTAKTRLPDRSVSKTKKTARSIYERKERTAPQKKSADSNRQKSTRVRKKSSGSIYSKIGSAIKTLSNRSAPKRAVKQPSRSKSISKSVPKPARKPSRSAPKTVKRTATKKRK